jgi:hypothetical protein
MTELFILLACFLVVCVVVVLFQMRSVASSLARSSRATAKASNTIRTSATDMVDAIDALAKDIRMNRTADAAMRLVEVVADLQRNTAELTKATVNVERCMVKKEQLKEAVNLMKRTVNETRQEPDTSLDEDINAFRKRIVKELMEGGKSVDEAEVIAAGMVYGSMGSGFGMEDIGNEAL